jgi:hypothetical protein
MPISKFLFGTGLESEIRIGFPLFDILTDREDGEGSDVIDVPDGSFDTWRQNKMFTMDTEVRWIPDGPGTNPVQTQLSGPVSWEEFVDWARDGRAFRFQPDENVPDFFVDNTYLVEPRKGFGSLSSDIKRNVRLKLRNPAKSFHEALRGIMFEYAPGASLTDPVAATFTRSSVAHYVSKGLTVDEALANVLRDRHHEGTQRTTLLEASRQNALDNGSADTDAVGWNNNGLTSLTRVTTDSPAFGAGHMQAVVPNSGGVGPFIRLRSGANVVASVGQLWSGAIRAKTNSSSPVSYHLRLDWYDSTPTFLSSATAVISIDGTYRRFSVRGTAPASTAGVQLVCYTNGAQGIHTVWFDLAQLEQAAFESSDIPTNSATVTRNADLFTWPFTFPLRDMFIFAEAARPVWPGLTGVGFPGLITVGDSSTGTLEIYSNAGDLVSEVRGAQNRSALQSIPAGDFAVCAQFKGFPNAVQTALDVGSGPGAFTATTVLAALANPRLRLGWSGSNSQALFGGLVRVKIGPLTFGGITRDTVAKALAA